MLLDRGRHCNRPTLPTWPTNSSFAQTSLSNRVQYSKDCLPYCCAPLCTRIYMCILIHECAWPKTVNHPTEPRGRKRKARGTPKKPQKSPAPISKTSCFQTGAPSSQNFRSFSYKRSSRISYSRHSRHPLALDKNR